METIQIPKGRYFLGDPCYAVPNDQWIPWLDRCDFMNEESSPIFNNKIFGHTVAAFNTVLGDGTYYDQMGRDYSVDAGLIGATSVDLVGDDPAKIARLNELGRIINLTEDGSLYRMLEGEIVIGIKAGRLKFEIQIQEEYDDDDDYCNDPYYDDGRYYY